MYIGIANDLMPEYDQKSALLSHVPYACYKLDHRLLVYFTALITQGGKYELRSSTLCNFLQPPATFSPVQRKKHVYNSLFSLAKNITVFRKARH